MLKLFVCRSSGRLVQVKLLKAGKPCKGLLNRKYYNGKGEESDCWEVFDSSGTIAMEPLETINNNYTQIDVPSIEDFNSLLDRVNILEKKTKNRLKNDSNK